MSIINCHCVKLIELNRRICYRDRNEHHYRHIYCIYSEHLVVFNSHLQ